MQKYRYIGPAYMYEKYLGQFKLETMAVSEDKALCNIRKQVADSIGYDIDKVRIRVEPKYLELANVATDHSKPTQFYKVCRKCGTRLTDGGYCPICDDGEEDY